MEQIVQLAITGLANGAILALAAMGFVLVFKATGVINFAQGAFLMLGAYLVWAGVAQLGVHWSVALLLALAVAAVLGPTIERTVLRPLVGQPIISVIMVTIGLSYFIVGVVQVFWGTRPRLFPDFIPSGTVEILGTRLPLDRLWAIGLAGLILIALTLFFQRSRHGIAMRAVADDQQAAMTMGISVRRVFAMAWALAAISAVFGGILLANLIGVSGFLEAFGLLVFPVVILGGLDSIPGAVVGGLIIGLLVTFTGAYVGGGLQTVVPYLVLVGVLLFKPYGLFGQVRIERV